MKKTKLYLNHAGFCLAKEHHAISIGRKLEIKFHALWGIIQHPEKGYILYDTAYSEEFYGATKFFPNKIYALITKVKISKNEEISSQLASHGISPNEIHHVIITHFHADHICGLKDFPNATFYTSSTALNHTLNLSTFFAFSKGVLKTLLPNDLKERTIFIDRDTKKMDDPIFGHKFDLFGDESIFVFELPGHAAGQIGIQLETQKRSYFLISDACWLKKSYEENILPNPIVRLFFDSWSDYKETLKKIHEFHKKNPTTLIVPTHCFETTSELIQSKISFDVL